MAQQVPIGQNQQAYYDAATMAQATGMIPGQPTQQVFQTQTQQVPPTSTVQAMQQQTQPQYQQVPVQPQVVYQAVSPQGITITQDDYNRQVEELAESKFKTRAQEVINNAVAAMKGVANNMFGQQQQQMPIQPQQCQQSFWETTTGKVTIGGIGGAIGVGGCKLISHFFGGNRGGGGYQPTGQEMQLVGEALKALFGR